MTDNEMARIQAFKNVMEKRKKEVDENKLRQEK